MNVEVLKERFKRFALEVLRFAEQLPEKPSYKVIQGQIIRSGSSAAANYRAACRRKSRRDFIAKMGIVEEELDETMFWLEFSVSLSEAWRPVIAPIWKEANELLAISISSIKTSRNSQKGRTG